ncbi:glycosyltransferase [Fluviibacterium sp. DFM31]|uniref:Glycosyltransferase n=1 Tax=Meridianimarinicoccus marinus TaxID=3231483 RepID=A0ABV3L5V8_9RHOB
MSTDPKLSIVVTIVDGGTYLRDFLAACERMEDTPPLELIVPYDASVADVLQYQDAFPQVRFLDLGQITPARPITTEAGQHELFDRRRAAGLAAATGDIIAILEDRGHPRPDWARTVVRLHAKTDYGVIGGAIDCKEPVSLLNWAFYVTDFGRYGLPFDSGPAEWVSDVNVTYSRKVLEDTRHLWQERFREPVVHWFLIDRGDQLLLSNELVVEHVRPPATLGDLLPERFHWGRLFGHIRAVHLPAWKRLGYILTSPLIPPLLWVRHGLTQASKGKGLRYLTALPYVMILTIFWTLGEAWGTITKRP